MNWARQVGGQGRTLVLLHGWGMEGRVFDPWLAYLMPHFRCVRYDLPGHGATPCAAGLGWEGSVTALAALLAEEGESPLLLGWSLGGLLALGLAARRPDLLSGLILMAASPAFRQRPDWAWGVDAATLAGFADALRVDPEGTRQRFLALQVMNDPQARQQLNAMRGWPLPDPRCLADGLVLLRDEDLRQELPPPSLPTLILHGERDRIVPVAAAQWLHAALPGSRYASFATLGHAPFLSAPAECARILLEWLA